VLRRYIQSDGRIGLVHCGRVVSDDDRGLLMWMSRDSAVIHRTTLTGEPTRYLPPEQKLRAPTLLAPTVWRGAGVLMLTPHDTAHSVWWFFEDDMDFRGWYINLETTGRRWDGGHDCFDQALDILVTPERTWTWKDEDEFAERTGVPGFWDADQAQRIRDEGVTMIKRAEAGEFPFDGTWCDFAPDPQWQPTALPWWWDQVPQPTTALRPPID
jgi:hypothetical protein